MWPPSKILSVIKRIGTSAEPLWVETDVGPAYVKSPQNVNGAKVLVAEVVGTRVAEILGLRTIPFAIMPVEGIDLTTLSGRKYTGTHVFASQEHAGIEWANQPGLVLRVDNANDFLGIVLLDTLTMNDDRCSLGNLRFQSIGEAPGKVSVLVLDQGNCFAGRDGWDATLATGAASDQLFGPCYAFASRIDVRQVSLWLDRLDAMSDDDINGTLSGIPANWDVQLDAIAGFLTARRDYLLNNFAGMLANRLNTMNQDANNAAQQ